MRVRLGILLVLLAAACGGLAWTHASVNAQKDQVDIQVTTVAGDVSAVEGTEVTLDVLVHPLYTGSRANGAVNVYPLLE